MMDVCKYRGYYLLVLLKCVIFLLGLLRGCFGNLLCFLKFFNSGRIELCKGVEIDLDKWFFF